MLLSERCQGGKHVVSYQVRHIDGLFGWDKVGLYQGLKGGEGRAGGGGKVGGESEGLVDLLKGR